MKIDGLSLDQFSAFLAVVDEGSFSAAARKLNRAQSAITYAIQKLEEQSGGLALFDRTAYRPTLTPAGHALLARARGVIWGVTQYRAQAADIIRGLESEVRLIVDMMTPMPIVQEVLGDFAATYPQVSVRLAVEFHDLVAQALVEGRAHIAIMAEMAAKAFGFEQNRLCDIEFVAVAAPAHPLAQEAGPLEPDILAPHVQLVVQSRVTSTESKEFGVVALNRWYLTDLTAKHALLLAGVGWGSMPRHAIADDLASGRLVEIKTARWEGSNKMPILSLAAAYRQDAPPGPAGRWLVDRLRRAYAGGDGDEGQIS